VAYILVTMKAPH